MKKTQITHLQFKEGPIGNYINALLDHFGGEVVNDVYSLKKGATNINLASYKIFPDLELTISEAFHNQAILLDRIPDDDPNLFHINIIKEGQFTQSYSSQKTYYEAGTTKGVFLYNGLFPLQANFPAHINYKSISFKLKKEALNQLMPEALPIFNGLFASNEGMAYHLHLPTEVDRLTNDLFHYKDLDFGRKSLVMARGLEAFTSLMKSIKQLVDKDELNGLHVDDYQRLLRIKTKLLSSFEKKITVDNLAEEFGVSISKLKRDFKALFDCSVYQFFTHAKMDEAFRRLKTGNFSVMEVGYDLGYQNLSKFSEMFKKVKGISPSEVIKLSEV